MTVWAVDQFDVVVIVTVAVSSDDQLPGFTVEDDNGVIMSPVENRYTLDSNSLITHTHTFLSPRQGVESYSTTSRLEA